MKKSYIFLISLIVLIISVSAVSAGFFSSNDDKIEVSNLEITDEGYDMYDVSCDLVAKKDIDYLELVVVFYDDSGAILDKSPLVWNMNSVPKDQTIKVSGSAFVSSGTPAKAEIFFFDDVFTTDLDDAIYNETVLM